MVNTDAVSSNRKEADVVNWKKGMVVVSALVAGLFLLLSALGMVAAAPAQSGASRPVKKALKPFDFEKTRRLIADWAVRKRFPDELTIAYYYTYSKMVLDGRVPEAVEKRIVRFVRACKRPDGGFASDPRYAAFSTVKDTYYAYRVLRLLKRLDAVNWSDTAAFLRSRMTPDGGFTNRAGDKGSTLVSTSWAVQVLAGLHALPKEKRSIMVGYIEGFRGRDGGFSMLKGRPSSPRATWLAVRALAALHALDPKTRQGVVAYLKTTRYSGLIKGKKYRTRPYVEELYHLLDAMALCGAVDQVGREEILHFLYRLYIPINGGFGPTPGLGTTPPSTFFALKSLALLELLPDPEAPPAHR